MYECPNCAANLKFNIAKQMLYCEYCETTVDPYAFHKEKDAEERTVSAVEAGVEVSEEAEEVYEVTIFTCPQCGGEILSEDTTAATFCSFCGSATILDSRISKERKPGYIIPFTKTKADCENAYMKMMKRAIFAPDELKDKAHIEKFRGIYMPYWVYSFEKKGPVTFPGKTIYHRGDYRYTKHFQLDCEIEESYKGLAYDASASFSDNLSNAIAPFDLRKGQPFAPTFLSGFYADTSDVDSSIYENEAEEMIIEDGCQRIAKHPHCKKYHVNEGSNTNALRNAIRPTYVKAELAMLPVWFLSYRKGDRVCYTVVNGQTGEAAADLPVEPKKYLIGSAILAIPLFILLNLFFTITPTKILWIAAALALICVVISNVQLSNIIARESGEDDKGLMASREVRPNTASESEMQDLADAMAEGREKQAERGQKKAGSIDKSPMAQIGSIALGVSALLLMLSQLARVMSNSSLGITRVAIYFFAILVIFTSVVRTITSLSKRGNNKSSDMGKYFKNPKSKLATLIKPIAGILLAVVIQILKPVADEFYYIGAFVCMGTVLWAIMDIIKQHNVLTTRKLPQFNRRGGDENA